MLHLIHKAMPGGRYRRMFAAIFLFLVFGLGQVLGVLHLVIEHSHQNKGEYFIASATQSCQEEQDLMDVPSCEWCIAFLKHHKLIRTPLAVSDGAVHFQDDHHTTVALVPLSERSHKYQRGPPGQLF